MGMRIHTAIGWGMPISQFLKQIRAPGVPAEMEDGWFDVFDEAMQHTKGMRGPKGLPLPITEPEETVLGLMNFVGYDTYSDVIMAPDMTAAKRWFRRNDDIDYAFHVGTRSPDDYDVPEGRIEYMPYGFHPYANERMHADGSIAEPPPVDDYRGSFDFPRDPGLLPGVPAPLRHWLTTSGLFERSGIALLRPVRAMWWS